LRIKTESEKKSVIAGKLFQTLTTHLLHKILILSLADIKIFVNSQHQQLHRHSIHNVTGVGCGRSGLVKGCFLLFGANNYETSFVLQAFREREK